MNKDGSGEPTKIDPELQRQLEQSAADDSPIGAVFRLRPPDPSRKFPTPEETRHLARQLLQDAAESFGGATFQSNVLENLGVLVLYAPPAAIRTFLDRHPHELASATANRQPHGSAMIRPVKKRKAN